MESNTSFMSIRWRWIVALTIAMGVLNGLNPRTLLLNPMFGLFLCIMLWFTNRPATWWYDVAFFGCMLVCALVAWLVSIGACTIFQLIIHSATGCQAVASPKQLLGITVFVLIPAAILYVATYVIFIANRLSNK